MLSDTAFNFPENIEEVVKEIDNILESGAGFHLFKLGKEETEFSRLMKRRRVGINEIDSTEDFRNIVLKFSKDLYGEAIRT